MCTSQRDLRLIWKIKLWSNMLHLQIIHFSNDWTMCKLTFVINLEKMYTHEGELYGKGRWILKDGFLNWGAWHVKFPSESTPLSCPSHQKKKGYLILYFQQRTVIEYLFCNSDLSQLPTLVRIRGQWGRRCEMGTWDLFPLMVLSKGLMCKEAQNLGDCYWPDILILKWGFKMTSS